MQWHNRYAQSGGGDFLSIMRRTDLDLEIAYKARTLQLSNVELIEQINQLFTESLQYDAFWDYPVDEK